MPEIDLRARARRAVIEAGFSPDFSWAALSEAGLVISRELKREARDLRGLLWSSVDNSSSRDIDQVEFVEATSDDGFNLYVGVADVADHVDLGMALDKHAGTNTVSVYAGVETFSMLPRELVTGATSLIEGLDRLALVVEICIHADGEVHLNGMYRAWVRNRARLTYEMVGEWLEDGVDVPEPIRKVEGLADQLRLQFAVAHQLSSFRERAGAITYSECEAVPVVLEGRVTGLTMPNPSCAREMIESFMVATNIAMAGYLRSKRIPALRRIVREPKRWDRIREIASHLGERLPEEPDARALSAFLAGRKAADPAGFGDLSLTIVKLLGPGEYVVEGPDGDQEPHFSLAVSDYTHSTAPNRRYADLVVQRLACSEKAPYTEIELERIARHCTERSRAARRVERLMRKVAAASLLVDRVGEVFVGMITGVKSKGTFVRLKDYPAEGRIVQNERGVDVGDWVRVRLAGVELENGFIDFVRL